MKKFSSQQSQDVLDNAREGVPAKHSASIKTISCFSPNGENFRSK